MPERCRGEQMPPGLRFGGEDPPNQKQWKSKAKHFFSAFYMNPALVNPKFSNDSYNKHIPGYSSSPGTLIGNWQEESVQREKLGVGRSQVIKGGSGGRNHDGTNKSDRNDTFSRVIGGEIADSSEGYRTNYAEELRFRSPGRSDLEDLRRERMNITEDLLRMRQEMARRIAGEYRVEKGDFLTTASASFKAPPRKGLLGDARAKDESCNVHYSQDYAPNTLQALEGHDGWPGKNASFSTPLKSPCLETKPSSGQKLATVSYVNEHSIASLPELRRVVRENLTRKFPNSDNVYDCLRKEFAGAEDVEIEEFITKVFSKESETTEYHIPLRILLSSSPWMVGPSKGRINVTNAIQEIKCFN